MALDSVNDYSSYFLLKNKAFKITIPVSTVIAVALIVLVNLLMPAEVVKDNGGLWFIKNSLELIVVMLLTTLSGYAVGSLAVFIVFALETFKYGFVYQPVLLMVASLISNLPVIRQWYKKKSLTALAVIMFTVVLGFGSNLLVIFLEDGAWENLKVAMESYGAFTVSKYIAIINGTYFLPSLLMGIIGYVISNFVPPRIRNLFFFSSYESEKIKILRQALDKNKKKGSIGLTVFFIIINEAVVLSIAAFGYSSGLILDQTGGWEDVVMVKYVTKLFFLMMMVAVPVILMSVSNVNVNIINPIRLMAKAVEDSSQVSVIQSKMPEDKIAIRELGIETQNEIGVLYDSLVLAVDNATLYMERIQREQELQRNLEIAEAATKAKSTFLSNMSHEIRTPINAVLGLDEMILRETSDPEILNYAQDIQNAGKSLLSLVNDILDFSKIEAGKMEIIPVEYDLSSTINDLVNMISKRAEDKGLELNINVDKNIPHLLYGDEIRIKQCVVNILTNAVKYTEKGSVTLTVSYEKKDDEHIELTIHVKDTGIGIKEEDLGKLFTAFQRIEEKRNRTIEGTGLGMNIVQQLLDLMGSWLMVDSVYGEGSDFYFTVGQKVIKWEPIGNFTDSYNRAKMSMERYHESFRAPSASILVTDDTPLNLTVIKGLLKQTQIQVDTATSGAETLQKVANKKYDIIFIDHRMPVMDGIETLEAMRTLEENLNAGVPCIALTANAVSGAREMYLAAGFTEYLSKPVDSKKLEKLLLDYLPKEKVELVTADDACGAANEEATSCPGLSLCTGINLEEAVKNCGSAEVLSDAIKEFHRAIDEKAALIEKYAAEKDYKNYTVLVHALKSSARLIGAKKLSEDALYLEKCGDSRNEGEVSAKTEALLELYREYKGHLAPLAQVESDEGKPEISLEDYRSALQNIKECMQAFDFSSADQIIEMLGAYKIPSAEKERFAKIKEKVSAVDQAAVLELL